MSNANLYRGGTPLFQAITCDGSSIFTPPFAANIPRDRAMGTGTKKVPPGTGAIDGVYQNADFSLGLPIDPEIMPHQVAELKAARIEVGDIIRCLVIPEHFYGSFLSFAVVNSDPLMNGATVALTSETLTYDTDGNEVWTEDTIIADSMSDAGTTNVFSLSTPSSAVVSLINTSGDFAQPYYAALGTAKVIGIKVLSMPTDTTINLWDMLNAMYITVRAHGFPCPSQV